MATRKSTTSAEKKPTTRKAPARKTAQAVAAPAAESSTQNHIVKHTPTHEEIAILAVQFWNERGRPYGSPEVDWHRAEQTLHAA